MLDTQRTCTASSKIWMEHLTYSLPCCQWQQGTVTGGFMVKPFVQSNCKVLWSMQLGAVIKCWAAIRNMPGARFDGDDSPRSPLMSWSKSGGYHISNPKIVLKHGDTVGIGTKPSWSHVLNAVWHRWDQVMAGLSKKFERVHTRMSCKSYLNLVWGQAYSSTDYSSAHSRRHSNILETSK